MGEPVTSQAAPMSRKPLAAEIVFQPLPANSGSHSYSRASRPTAKTTTPSARVLYRLVSTLRLAPIMVKPTGPVRHVHFPVPGPRFRGSFSQTRPEVSTAKQTALPYWLSAAATVVNV